MLGSKMEKRTKRLGCGRHGFDEWRKAFCCDACGFDGIFCSGKVSQARVEHRFTREEPHEWCGAAPAELPQRFFVSRKRDHVQFKSRDECGGTQQMRAVVFRSKTTFELLAHATRGVVIAAVPERNDEGRDERADVVSMVEIVDRERFAQQAHRSLETP